MNETKFNKELRDSIRIAWPNTTCLKIPGGAMSAGLPDIIVVTPKHRQRSIFIECKVTSYDRKKPFDPLARVSERQAATLSQIRRATAPVFVALRFSKIHALFINLFEITFPIPAEHKLQFDPDPETFDKWWPGPRPEAAISTRRTGGVWDNLDFLLWERTPLP